MNLFRQYDLERNPWISFTVKFFCIINSDLPRLHYYYVYACSSSLTTSSPNTPGERGTVLFRFTDPALNARALTVKDQLLQWCQSKTVEYEVIIAHTHTHTCQTQCGQMLFYTRNLIYHLYKKEKNPEMTRLGAWPGHCK